ncbi:MAG TPA: S8 family serine peptidase [Streptosporangiaceae bacterium]|jgi:subtilisin family serine protease|nr:S8 family serine peptidase [Streptosporangiaceae bacterium]
MTDETPQTRGAAAPRQNRAAAARARKGAPAGTSRPDRAELRTRPYRYLLAAVPPADMRVITSQLKRDQARRVLGTLSSSSSPGGFPGVAVIETTPEHAAMLAAYPGIHIEPDYTAGPRGQTHAVLPPVVTQRAAFEVLDDRMRPIEGAAITVAGSGFPVTGFTGPDGRAEITLTPQVLTAPAAIEIHPPRGCWPVRVPWPLLGADGPVRVICTRITTTYPEFPERALDSWGARVMGFGWLPPTYRGNGVRVALIDSGVAAGHPDLSGRIEHGRDLIGRDEQKGWQEDLIGTGTHHATLIAGRDDGTGIVGLAPEADIHICRVSPGGSAADLIEALDYCIEQQVDVAMFGAGIPEQSVLLAGKVEEARQNGIACIAAADSGGLCWPAALPQVLAVGAIGQLGTFPPETADTATLSSPPSPEGFFVPVFSSGGPGSSAVDCCAPGVAVISGLPPSSYGPLSSAGTAAAHATALAALILAHHPLFRQQPGRPDMTRDSARPARLLEVIKGSCRPLPQLDPARTGAGIPDAAVALSVAPWATHPPLSMPYPAPAPAPDGRTPLEPLTAAMRAAGLLAGDEPPGSRGL